MTALMMPGIGYSSTSPPAPGSVTLAMLASGFLLPANQGGTGVANNVLATLTRSGNHQLTLTTTNTTSLTLPTSGTVATSSSKLSAFAATTSAELITVISDETGTGALVFANTPTLVTPVLGAATATSVNKVALTAPASAATLTLADGSTLATSGANSITFTSTGATNVTLPTSGTLATESYVSSAVAGLLDYKGAYNAATNSPDLDTAPSGVLKGDMYTVTAAGTFFTAALEIGDAIIAEVDAASTEADWTILQKNLLSPLNADTVTVADAADDTTTFPLLGTAATGALTPATDSSLSYNASTGALTATSFVGALTGNAATVTGFTPASGSLVLAGADALTLTTSADSNVTLPTTGTLATLAGTETLSAKTLAAPVIDHAIEPASNGGYSGNVTNDLQAGATVAQYELVILNSSSQWVLTDANASATYAGMLALALEAKTSGQAMLTALPGSYIRNDSWTWTAGATLYMSETAGAITATAPVTTDSATRVIGYALTDDCIFFNPSNDYITHV